MPRLIALLPLIGLAACAGHGDDYRQAKALIADRCAACHVVPGVAGAMGMVGPSLAGIARQQVLAGHFENRPDVMIRWLMHPQAMLPGNAMPEVGLTRAQAATLTTYLYTLDKR